MTKRKRKSPERKPAVKVAGLLLDGVGAVARLVGRHPRSVGGFAAFAVTFGFIAANALWYQPGQHPSPIFSTRDVSDFNALAGVTRHAQVEPDPADVTSFKIERATEAADEEAMAAAPADSRAAAPQTAAATYDQPSAALPAAAADNAALVVSVQTELARRGLYDGLADGVIGPRTEAAITVFQKSVGLEADGLVGPELLAALKADRSVTAAVPKSRPPEDLSAAAADPVAAAIRNASKVVTTAPVSRTATPAALPVSLSGTAADAALVMEIQRGLANIAYTDVSVDGVAGEQTRAAIRRFERHYRLPETGEPSEAVLRKLRDIGAL